MNNQSGIHQQSITAPQRVLDSNPVVFQHTAAVVVVGGGAAGLLAALQAASWSPVVLLTRFPLLNNNSALAQGGIAAALATDDSPLLHRADTLDAGAGLSDSGAVDMLVRDAPRMMHVLDQLGVPFDRQNGQFALGLEANHSRRRILHVGDATGLALTRTLTTHVQNTPAIQILEGYQVIDLICSAHQCSGVLALDPQGMMHHFSAGATILATGGAGALYGKTSNSPGAIGEGIALAYRAGAEVADMEFVQFHPTVFTTPEGRGFLISEATRGEGGVLRTPGGYRFMPDYDQRAELAPRDIVTRSIFDVMQREGSDHVLLDLTHLPAPFLQQRFPTIVDHCRKAGIDPSTMPIPIAPAAHYLMGGIRTDLEGRTSQKGLYAVGECACTGVHGANRLASNSLLECLVVGDRAAQAIRHDRHGRQAKLAIQNHNRPVSLSRKSSGADILHLPASDWRDRLAMIVGGSGGPLRSGEQLIQGLHQLESFPLQSASPDPESITAANAALTARLILSNALVRVESRGAHTRTDYPKTSEQWAAHLVQRSGSPIRLVATIAQPEYQEEYHQKYHRLRKGA